jgi:uncharacterized repeat protein (TIGR01451 family)
VRILAHDTRTTAEEQPFVARLTMPAGLDLVNGCEWGSPSGSFDPVTRVFTWPSRFNGTSPVGCVLWTYVPRTLDVGTSLPFTATLTTPSQEQNTSNNTVSQTLAVVGTTDLGASASADVTRVRTGSTFTFTGGVQNLGEMTATEVSVTHRLSPHVTFLSAEQISGPAAALDPAPYEGQLHARIPALLPGATAQFRIAVLAHEIADIYHVVQVRSAGRDPDSSNDQAYAGAYAGPDADLGVTSTRVPVTTAAQIPVTFTISNGGPDPVDNVTLEQILRDEQGSWELVEEVKYVSATSSQGSCSDPYAAGPYFCPPAPGYWTVNCNLGTLAAGDTATVTVIIDRGKFVGRLENTARVSPTQNDPRSQNNAVELDVSRAVAKRARSLRK